MVVVTGGLGTGQLLLGTSDPSGFTLFLVASILISLAVLPVSLTRIQAPEIELPSALPFALIARVAPLGIAGAFVTGLANGAILGMGAVYAKEAGFSVGRTAIFMALILAGAVLFQWPIGSLSDKLSRRTMILSVTTIAGLVALIAAAVEPMGSALLVTAAIIGGFSFPMYSLSVSHTNDLIPTEQLVPASAVLVFTTAVGSVLGPPLAAVGIDRLGPKGFWLTVAFTHATLGIYAAYRLVRRRVLPIDRHRPWARVPSRSSALISGLYEE